MHRLVSCTLVCLLGSNAALAHHSFAASFTETEIMREGVVERLVFRNPHVLIYMRVTDDLGEQTTWMVEGRAANSLRNAGWSAVTVSTGDLVRVNGMAGRNDRPMISMESLAVLDPTSNTVQRIVPLRGAAERTPGELASLPLLLPDGRPNLTGAWLQNPAGPDFRRQRPPPFNAAGAALQANWDPKDDPSVACEDPNLIRQAGFTPHPVRIEQYDDRVVISYEEYGGVRTIWLNGREAGKPGDSHLKPGRSTARYQEDRLIIESTHISAGPTGIFGRQLSDQVTTVETYRRADSSEYGPMLEMEMLIVDPLYLSEPWEMVWTRPYAQHYEFIPVECHVPI